MFMDIFRCFLGVGKEIKITIRLIMSDWEEASLIKGLAFLLTIWRVEAQRFENRCIISSVEGKYLL